MYLCTQDVLEYSVCLRIVIVLDYNRYTLVLGNTKCAQADSIIQVQLS